MSLNTEYFKAFANDMPLIVGLLDIPLRKIEKDLCSINAELNKAVKQKKIQEEDSETGPLKMSTKLYTRAKLFSYFVVKLFITTLLVSFTISALAQVILLITNLLAPSIKVLSGSKYVNISLFGEHGSNIAFFCKISLMTAFFLNKCVVGFYFFFSLFRLFGWLRGSIIVYLYSFVIAYMSKMFYFLYQSIFLNLDYTSSRTSVLLTLFYGKVFVFTAVFCVVELYRLCKQSSLCYKDRFLLKMAKYIYSCILIAILSGMAFFAVLFSIYIYRFGFYPVIGDIVMDIVSNPETISSKPLRYMVHGLYAQWP